MTRNRQSVFMKIIWGAAAGTIIALALGVPTTLVAQWLLDWYMQRDGRSHLMNLGVVSIGTVGGVVLLAMFISRLRMAALTNGAKHERPAPRLRHALKFGAVLGLVIGIGNTICFSVILMSLFEESQSPLEAWHLLTGVGVSIVYVAATGCVGALAAVAGVALARIGDQGRDAG